MARKYKVKRYRYAMDTYKARPHPVFIAVMLALAGALIYLGAIVYPPVYNLIMNSVGKTPEPPGYSLPEPDDAIPAAAGQPEPEPEPEPAGRLRAVYLSPALLSGQAELERLLDNLSENNINTVMIDIKDRQGRVLFKSANQSAAKWGTVAPNAADLAQLSQRLKDKGISLIARMSAFRDDAAARADLSAAVNYRAAGTTWLDNFPASGGKAWLNPYSAAARGYLTELAVEAVDNGAVMVVLEDFHFPPNSLSGDAYFGAESAGISREECLSGFARSLNDTLKEKGARAAVYMTVGAIASPPSLTLYSCPPQNILADTVVLGVLAYQFPAEGFKSEGLNVSRPLDDPAGAVRQSLKFALEQIGGTEIIPMIQGGNESNTGYTAAQIMEQIEAAADLGIDEYILYSADSSYPLLEADVTG